MADTVTVTETPDEAAAVLQKHALYFLYDSTKTIIFVGHSRRLLTSFGAQRPWITEVAGAKVLWFDTRAEAVEALNRFLDRKVPKYNAHRVATYLVQNEDGSTRANLDAGRVPAGYCPKCGRQKERPLAAYCNPCFNVYQKDKKARRGHTRAGAEARLAATGRVDGRITGDNYKSHLDGEE